MPRRAKPSRIGSRSSSSASRMRVGEQAAQAERARAPGSARRRRRRCSARRSPPSRRRSAPTAGRLLEIADEGLLERARRRAPRSSAAGVSLASTRPACISEMRSQRSASFMKWVETKIVTPWLRDRSISSSQKLSRATGSTPEVGSSRISISGSWTTATASDSRWRMPERQSSARAGRDSRARPNRSTSSSMRAVALSRAAGETAARAARGSAARSARCRARRPATCSRRARASRCRWRRPAGRTASASPSVAGSRPVSIFIVVVLPQPLEPRKPKISPRSMRKLT